MKIVASKPTITRKELEGVLDCLIQDSLASGTIVKQFETACANILGMKYSVALNTETAAYHVAFVALGIEAGDEVIIPSFFSEAVLRACHRVGAQPVLVDNAEGSYHPSTEIIKKAITPKTKALNYAFDITPARLITGLITERGICEPTKIKELFPEKFSHGSN